MKEIHILLVEDNLADQEIVKEVLADAYLFRYSLEVCDCISEAIARIEQQKPSVILLDLSLPDGVGLQNLEQLQEKDLSIPIVILTGLDDPNVGIEAINKGAEDYLSKPEINNEHLLAKTITFAIERNKLKRELFQAMNNLQKYNEKLRDYAYVITHDLKSPLVNLRSLVDLYFQSDDTALHQKVMGRIGSSINRLDNMIRSFSNVFLVEKDLEKEPETIDIAQAITEVEDQLGELVRSSNTRISTDLSQASTVLFVPVLFRSILQNLITNSIKYSNTNREPRIFITTEDSDDYVIIHFEDNGIGINLEKHQKQLFKLFKRFSTETAEGMGVGLYMVKSIMDANDGQVNIDSTPGEGTRFDLFFRKEKELAL